MSGQRSTLGAASQQPCTLCFETRLAGQLAPGTRSPTSAFIELGLHTHHHHSQLWRLDSVPHADTASILPTEPSPQPNPGHSLKPFSEVTSVEPSLQTPASLLCLSLLSQALLWVEHPEKLAGSPLIPPYTGITVCM